MQLFCVHSNDSFESGKQKIFLCCHPFFSTPKRDRLINELAKLANSSVFIDTAPGTVLEDQMEDLTRMNLMIFVVSRELFMTETPHRQLAAYCGTAFNVARKNNIPILPVAAEDGVVEEFNEKFGALHCLNVSHLLADLTGGGELGEAEKKALEKWLNDILISDKDIDTIREHFNAYAFLSYRKKDRQYVDSLMRLIHSYPEYRDTAIWYDDYLVPGENFNEAISSAMDKSKLFSLLVTPNLLEENNYVMTTEYKYAQKEKKTVLPVEMVSTDRELLDLHYRDLPECVPADDPDALDRALTNLAENLSLKSQSDTPEHLFFIGLAYLAGIDVEIDPARANELIRRSAEAGFHGGMLQLAVMYRRGVRVPQDTELAIHWTKQYLHAVYESYADIWDIGECVIDLQQEFTEPEYRFIHGSRKLFDGLHLLLSLYQDEHRDIEEICAAVMPLCHFVYEKLLFIEPLVTQFDVITGYEKVRSSDGKWTLKSVHEKKIKLTGCAFNPERESVFLTCEKTLYGKKEAVKNAIDRYEQTSFYITVTAENLGVSHRAMLENIKSHCANMIEYLQKE